MQIWFHDDKEKREYNLMDKAYGVAGSRVLIACGFCGDGTWAYVRSMSSNGKRCDHCPAVHSHQGYSFLKKVELMKEESSKRRKKCEGCGGQVYRFDRIHWCVRCGETNDPRGRVFSD